MSVVEYTSVKLKGVEAELKRIADALEIIIANQYGIRMRVADKPSGEEPEASYSNDLESFKRELLDISNGIDPNRVIEDE